MRPNSIHQLQILVVDDEPAVALALKSSLAFCGYRVETAQSVKAALRLMDAEPGRFAAVTTDHAMPDANGLEMVRALRERGFAGRVVVISAYLGSDDQAEYERLRVDRILQKPFNLSCLRKTMAELLPALAMERRGLVA